MGQNNSSIIFSLILHTSSYISSNKSSASRTSKQEMGGGTVVVKWERNGRDIGQIDLFARDYFGVGMHGLCRYQ